GPLPGTSHTDLVQTIVGLDPETKAVFVRLGSAHVGFATANEIGRLLKAVRDRGVTVTCHADGLDNSTLLLASLACSEIWISPAGGVDSVGIAFSLMFGKEVLEKLGVGVDFLQVGKYKGAQEPYTRNEPSPEARESLEETLRDLRNAWVEGVVSGRQKPLEPALEDGPHTAKAAKELGLIDSIGYLDEARDHAKEAAGLGRTEVVFGGGPEEQGGGIAGLLRSVSGGASEGVDHVAVLRATGAITMGGGGGLFGGEDGITEASLGKAITQLTEDDDVKAVVLRIDSPGGSALASDLLWHKLMKLRKKKPLIVSVGGMAASGGYYLACAGDRIYAEPTSIVGSIGVVAGKFALHDPLAKIGINTVTLPAAKDPLRAKRASYLSPFDGWDDATRAKVLAGMTEIYDTFIARIVEGRGLDIEVVKRAAEGRISGGVTAKERKLVDEIGGLDDAIRYAKEKAGLPADAKARVRGQPGGLMEMLAGDQEAAARARERAEAAVDPFQKLAAELPAEARDWWQSARPMSEGETMLTTMPFVLIAR
ncbi:MAG: signal peptide peptidase SppA, partial [Myxococcales bacterium]|nr:signal peptide peptidase SppA [Myxococcales bacterium]